MKPRLILLLFTIFTFTTVALGQGTKTDAAGKASQSQLSQEQPSIASIVDKEIETVEKEVMAAAEAMPEDKYNFSPDNLKMAGSSFLGVRTFASQLKHIAASNNAIWSAVTGDKLRPEDFNRGNGPKDLKTKSEIIKFLKDSFALGHKAAASLTVENMSQIEATSKLPRLYLATFAVAHAYDHYGQITEYLRMNGIVPPSTASQK